VPPAVPSMPIVVNNSNSIGLSWNAAAGAITYKVKRGTVSGGPYTLIATVSTTSYTDAGVTSGSPYYYVVSSMGNTLESANSAEAFGVPGASTRTWKPTPATTNLNLAGNWVENALPVNPTILTFGAASDTVLTNDITGLVASKILFDANADSYTISGNSITLKNDLVNNSAIKQTISTPLVLNSQLNVNTNNQDVYLSGVISGTGSLLKTGGRILFISGANTYTGGTTINGTIGGWPPQNGIGIAGHGTGTQSVPTAGPLGTGKIIMNGGSLYSEFGDATVYNDIEVTAGKKSYMYETSYALNLRGKLLGTGSLEHDGNTYAGLHLYGDNSEFAGTFISKLRSGNQRVRFEVPQSGSAKAHWLLDANGVDCHGIMFSTGTLHFGGQCRWLSHNQHRCIKYQYPFQRNLCKLFTRGESRYRNFDL
jgi:autotransporter-associated beta strand protein